MMNPPSDYIWDRVRQFTTARIGLGRAGTAIPTAALLDFQLAFAKARDAVGVPLDIAAVCNSLAETAAVRSRASDRKTFLLRPDLGRLLDEESVGRLKKLHRDDGYDLAIVIGDGLSAGAAELYAPKVLAECRSHLDGWTIAPIVVASQARVALADHIGETLGARMAMILLGERPGLTTAQSLGIYLTWNPRVGTQDSARNCISNVHETGMNCTVAARAAAWLVKEATRLKVSGVSLKMDATSPALTDRCSRPALNMNRN